MKNGAKMTNGDTTRKTALVTGASSGLGKATAIALARKGWNVIGHGRDKDRSDQAEAEIKAAAVSSGHTNARIQMLRADLASMAEISALAKKIAAIAPVIDAIIANAGGVRAERVITNEGNEATFAGNHLGHFLLVTRLLSGLMASSAPRIISVSSSAHNHCEGIDWDDPQIIKNWRTGACYCQAKLANVLFTRELAKRYGAEGLVAHAVDPGVIGSNFVNHADAPMRDYMNTLDLRPPAEACDPLVWLATGEGGSDTNGLLWSKREAIACNPAALNETEAAKLWEYSAKLCANY